MQSSYILAEQLPAHAACDSFSVLRLGDAPISAGATAYQKVNALILGEVCAKHISVFFNHRKVVLCCFDCVLVNFIGIVTFNFHAGKLHCNHATSHSIK